MTFEDFKLHPNLITATRDMGYAEPTPIQARTIPPILEGRDVTGLAQTGTGKTAAFVLPLLHHLLGAPGRALRAVILSPTRELSEQTHAAIGQLAGRTALTSATIYGGVNIATQIKALRRGVDIVVACPGRLLDHVQRRTIDLATVRFLILDEADQMFDMGFLPDIRKIIGHLPNVRQRMLFSATMPPDIQTLTQKLLKDPVRIQVDRIAPARTVSHTFFRVGRHTKNDMLNHLLGRTGAESVLVFTRTKHRSKTLARQLASSGFAAAALHGNLSQPQRQKAMAGFRRGDYRVLVATDVAARGIDVLQIAHVVNYDMPGTPDAYTHRTGRTGRAARTGEAYTFVSEEDAIAERAIRRLLGARFNVATMEGVSAAPRVADRQPSRPAAQGDRPLRHAAAVVRRNNFGARRGRLHVSRAATAQPSRSSQ
jgi:ATP-dependent RNA helicase RhlE